MTSFPLKNYIWSDDIAKQPLGTAN